MALLLLPVPPICPYQVAEDAIQEEVTLVARERLSFNPVEPPVRFAIRNSDPQTGLIYTVDDGGLSDASAWQIQIFDRRGRKVSFVQGNGVPPALVSWSGISDSGEPLPDGSYDATFGWRDSARRIHTTKKITFSLMSSMEVRGLTDWKLRFKYTDEGLVVSIAESMMFRLGESEIQDEALPSMMQVAAFLKTCSSNMVTVRGYTDSSGSARRNLFLSRERANRVYQYLVDAGINPNRLTYEGLGAVRVAPAQATEEGSARDRRVEVVVMRTTI